MSRTTELRWCAGCADEAVFERFDCADHPADCLELVCTRCELGLELGGSRSGAVAADELAGRAEPREAAA